MAVRRQGGPTGRWRLTLPGGTRAPSDARAQVAGLRVGGERSDDLMLLVSEVVTNAIRHGGARDDAHVVLELVSERRRLQVRVLDGGRGVPAPREPGASGGFGLHLVEALADAWGAAPGEVWFELRH